MTGRSDKKFCDLHCKSSYHYRRSLEEAQRFYNFVDNQLRQNRRLLKAYNKSGKSTIRAKVLHDQGFNPKFFTHYWKNTKGDVYLFVYEYGFLKRHEHDVEKYVLITWQSYMGK
ncbi:hypothetical protein [Tamlana fucoidanivorans]